MAVLIIWCLAERSIGRITARTFRLLKGGLWVTGMDESEAESGFKCFEGR